MRLTKNATLSERVWDKVQKTDNCWEWTGAKNPKGYGMLTYHNEQFLVHRVSYELAFGPIPPGIWVLHHCDNPACVRPDHLFLGTVLDNNRDMTQKGRHGYTGSLGESHPNHLLTEDVVRQIRAEYKAHTRGLRIELAKKYGVTPATIKDVVSRRSWRHVN